MFNVLDSNNLGKEYKGFILLTIEDLPDYKSKAVFLRHKRTGLEIYHIINDDKENLFAYGFRTISKDSKGTAHIMEHSTLCGSEKFPLKEPFTTLAGTSLNTFLNAMTYPDKTVYPGASVVRSDYFTMMDVYTDSVFFPKLERGTFLQEGHRLEMDENGKCSVQGVVYNEMKGNFSSFHSIAFSNLIDNLFPESYPAFNSGGDPVEIPNLTYEEFLSFHQKFYNPDNCLLFLYGNIPTTEQIDFLDQKFISRIEKKYGVKSEDFDFASPVTNVKPEIKELQKLNFVKESREFRTIAPQTGATGNFVSMNWYSGPVNIEKVFLSEVLFGNDSAPISYALKQSQLGDDVSCGNFGQFREEFFTIGLNGVKKADEQKLYTLIQTEIQKVYENGVSEEYITSAIMGIDFILREVNRYWGPYSITLMEKVMKVWQWGLPCSVQLNPITQFEKLKEQIKADKDFTKKLIKKYFIDQKVCVKNVVEPSKKYFEERTKSEQELILRLEKNCDKEILKKDLDELHAYQARIETPEETACIPYTKISELDTNLDIPTSKMEFVKGFDNSDIPLFVSKEETNGIFYIEVMYPFDRIEPKYLEYLPLLSDTITNLGWNNKPWDKCISESGCVMGDVWGKLDLGYVPDVPLCNDFAKQYQKYNVCGRNWISVACKALTSKAKESLEMLSEILTKMDFKDTKRFSTLIQENYSEKKANLISSGRDYATKRVRATYSKQSAVNEILWGVSQLYTTKKYLKTPASKTLKLFKTIYDECVKSGGIIHVIADEDSLNTVLPLIKDFAIKSKITKLLPSAGYTLKDLKPYIKQSDYAEGDKNLQIMKYASQTGYSVAMTKAAKYLTKEAAAEAVLNSWISMHSLWDKIRTTGGAYGANAFSDNPGECMVMSSYRDPSPEKSLEAYREALKDVVNNPVSAEDIEKTIVSCFGDAIIPATPKDRGAKSFEGIIYGNPQEFKKIKLDYLLKLTPEDILETAKRLYENTGKYYKTAIFCDKSKKIAGNIVKIPL